MKIITEAKVKDGDAILLCYREGVRCPWQVAINKFVNFLGATRYSVVAWFRTEAEARAYANRLYDYSQAEGTPGWANCQTLVPVKAVLA